MTYARISEGLVVEFFSPQAGFTIDQCFTQDVAAQFADITGVSPVPQQGWTAKQSGSAWSFEPPPGPTLAEVQAQQALFIKDGCQIAIMGGFTSSALGSAYAYPSDDNTQRNIAMAASAGGSLWCETGSTWAMLPHTVAQAQQVQKDLFAMIQANQTKYSGLLAEVDAATTAAAVQAIIWA